MEPTLVIPGMTLVRSGSVSWDGDKLGLPATFGGDAGHVLKVDGLHRHLQGGVVGVGPHSNEEVFRGGLQLQGWRSFRINTVSQNAVQVLSQVTRETWQVSSFLAWRDLQNGQPLQLLVTMCGQLSASPYRSTSPESEEVFTSRFLHLKQAANYASQGTL
jgi:hypothetical protein